ncbi:hypothetical protein E3P99_03390 [Wallemia hederae]|uniref:Uncharacterized protein n=1 Tax=Wallemia hederae TaxID=1540922 RepID=A0A4T0FFJ3_9BASI|nr:hypothetical protein E3P99_03390 [Wallemia hederae]
MSQISAQQITTLGHKHLGSGLARMTELVMESGQGSYLSTNQGDFLDFTSGIGVTNLGHCHPTVTAHVIDQIKSITHAQCTLGYCRPYVELVHKLLPMMPSPALDTILFFNSGSEAIDNAIKVVRKSTGRQNLICMQGGFHGRTYGSASLSKSKTVYSHEVGPSLTGVFTTSIPYWHQMGVASDHSEEDLVEKTLYDLDHLFLQQCAPADTAAIFIEPVIGEGGYIPIPAAFLRGLRERCDRHGILLVVDEIQSGFGRTGAMFAIEHSGVAPDVITFAKGIANGLPLSGMAAHSSIMNKMGKGMQGGTYSGNAVACAAGLGVTKVFKEENILANVNLRSKELFDTLHALQASDEGKKLIADVRGLGLMVGIEFKSSKLAVPADKHVDFEGVGAKIHKKCLEKGLFILTTSIYDVIRFIPPLNITREDMAKGLGIFEQAFYETAKDYRCLLRELENLQGHLAIAATAELFATFVKRLDAHSAFGDLEVLCRAYTSEMQIQAFNNEQYIPATAPMVQSIKYNGLVFISGCISLDLSTGGIAKGGIAEHGVAALDLLKDALERAGTSPSKVLKVTCFFNCHLSEIGPFNEVYAAFFARYNHKPCRTGVQVAGLPVIDGVQALIEIESLRPTNEDDRAWSKEEDNLLLKLVAEFGSERGKQSNWPVIASYFPKRTMKNCRKRYFYTLDTSIVHGKWSREEDEKLLSLVERYGCKWKEISGEMKGRTDDQCSSRFLNCLQCKNTPWTAEEDATLLNLFEIEGPMWAKISMSIPGRSALNCRNRYRKFGGMHTSNRSSTSRSRQRKSSSACSDSLAESTDASPGGSSVQQGGASDISTFNSLVTRMFPQVAPEDAFSTLVMMQLHAIPSHPQRSEALPLELEGHQHLDLDLDVDLPQPSASHSIPDLQSIFPL